MDNTFLEKYGSMSGLIISYKEGKKPDKIQPNQMSTGHERLEEDASARISRISGIDPLLRGFSERQLSGYATSLIQKQGYIVVEGLFDNFSYSKQLLGERILDFIRYTDIFSDAEIRSIVQDNNINISTSMLHNKAIGQYGVKVDLSPNAPTVRISNFLTLLELRKAGAPIPDKILIEAGDFPNKEEIIASLAQPAMPPAAGIAGGVTKQPNTLSNALQNLPNLSGTGII